MALPQYIKDAQNNYNAKFDIIQLKLPQGTKDRIRAIIGKDGSMTAYCKQSVLIVLEIDEDLRKEAPEETAKQSQTEPIPEPAEEVPQEQPKEPEKAYREPTLEEMQALQALIDAKKAEQDRRAEELRQQKEEQERQEQEERQAELMEHLERIRNGEALEEDEEKEKLRQESLLKANIDY